MFKIISSGDGPVPTYVADTKAELAEIKRQQYDSNVLGITCLVLDDGDGKPMVYMLDSKGEWV